MTCLKGGADTFVFVTNDGSDTIGALALDFITPANTTVTGSDFKGGVDTILLDGFEFATEAKAFAKVSDVGGVATFAEFGDQSSQQSATLAAVSLDTGKRTRTAQSGTLNRAADTASIGTFAGSLNADRTAVTLTDGGSVALLPSGNAYSVRYIATPTTGDRIIGIVGAVTPTASMPSGTATLNGLATVSIQDGMTIYDLTGDAEIAANFGTNRVTTTLSGLNGTRSDGVTPTANVSDVAEVNITGSTITCATFEGGTVGMTSSTLSDLSASASTSVNGAFFGPTGQEAGGVLIADDTATGNLRIFGDFIGK